MINRDLIKTNYNLICALIAQYEEINLVFGRSPEQVEGVYLNQLTRLPVKEVFTNWVARYLETIMCELMTVEYPDHLKKFGFGVEASFTLDKTPIRERLYQQKLSSFKEDLDEMLKDYL